MTTTLFVVVVLALVAFGAWKLGQSSNGSAPPGASGAFQVPESQYGAPLAEVEMNDTRASGAGKRVHARWDTANRLAPEEMEAYEAAAERKDMRQRGYVQAGGSYVPISSMGQPQAIGRPAPSVGLSAARQAMTLLQRKPEAQVHFSGLSQEDRRTMEQALGPLYVAQINYDMDGDGELIILVNPTASEPVQVLRDGNGGFIRDPFSMPDYLSNGRFEVRFVERQDGTMHAYCTPEF